MKNRYALLAGVALGALLTTFTNHWTRPEIVIGTIQTAQVYAPASGRFGISPSRWAGVRYSYEYEGRRYRGNSYFCRLFEQEIDTEDRPRVEELFNRLNAGRHIAVVVNSGIPKISCVAGSERLQAFAIEEY